MARGLAAGYSMLLFILWVCILGVKGTAGVISWWLVQAAGVLGVIMLLVTVVQVVQRLLTRRPIRLLQVGMMAVSLLGSWPLGWLMGIGQIAYPADVNDTAPAAYIRLPVDAEVRVGWGGDTLADNYHVFAPNERWAYDLLAEPAAVRSRRLTDYGIYGMEVVAPASGTVVAVQDEEADLVPGTEDYQTMAGNHIVIQLDDTGTYLFIAHLKQHSVIVREGQHVEEGMPIAEAGNSGSSSEPHIHIHHQRQNPATTPLFLAEGLPLFFRDIEGPAMPRGGVAVVDGVEKPVGDVIKPKGFIE
ncbi:M23 family metallopeptidase [Paenibacillus tarimensis]|uniref:M23 family metallopeptidase n=1 Tax=Paenibacillus tarimensis TaxID=416012 RepID=UPI001F20BFC1|nr:M23 family metallopeptidase [Paenibacillus tarimensis]MCF2944554.1 M23 family metallopeptidase [Paenibacillus tarimensis]